MMKRITFDGLFCGIAKCEDTPGGSYYENGTCSQRQVWERLRAIENILGDEYDLDHLHDLLQAEKDGRLVVLPSKTVYELTWDAGPGCDLRCPVSVGESGLCDYCDNGKLFVYERPCTQELLKELGKTVFLTREEAEAALQKGGTHET